MISPLFENTVGIRKANSDLQAKRNLHRYVAGTQRATPVPGGPIYDYRRAFREVSGNALTYLDVNYCNSGAEAASKRLSVTGLAHRHVAERLS
jgi:hypothetical protein